MHDQVRSHTDDIETHWILYKRLIIDFDMVYDDGRDVREWLAIEKCRSLTFARGDLLKSVPCTNKTRIERDGRGDRLNARRQFVKYKSERRAFIN